MLGIGAWQNQGSSCAWSGDGWRSRAGEGGMLMAVTCEAFECARAPALESERDELAAGDGERAVSSYSDAGEQCGHEC